MRALLAGELSSDGALPDRVGNVGGPVQDLGMTDQRIAEEAEYIVQSLAEELLEPRGGECLLCYVADQLDEFGCDGTHRFSQRYQERVAPRATALLRRLGRRGAYCDCEIFLNAFDACGGEPETLPPCAGVRRGSTQPCRLWWRRRDAAY